MFTRVLFCTICALGCTAGVLAQPLGTTFTYQAELRSSGVPASGLHDLRFRLYDAASAGNQVGATLCADNLSLTNGRFTIDLDFGAVFAGQQRFLEIDVRADTGLGCGNATGFTTLVPRQPLTAAPNAAFALNAATAANATTATTASNATLFNGQSASFYQNASNLSSGTLPGGLLGGTYSGILTFSNAGNVFTGGFSGSGAGLTGLNASNIASGTLADARLTANVALLHTSQTFTGGKAFSTAPAFTAAAGSPFFVTSTAPVTNLNADLLDGLHASAFLQSIPNPLTLSGTSATQVFLAENAATDLGASAIRGRSTAASGLTYGVIGVSNSTAGRGVAGQATAGTGAAYGVQGASASTDGRGVYGTATAASGSTYGGYFEAASPDAAGVLGLASATSGLNTGVYGRSDSTAGRAVVGYAGATNGDTRGVYGLSESTSGRGVFGWALASSGTTYGVYGQSESANGRGVCGIATRTTGTTYGVFGRVESPSGAAVYGEAIAGSGNSFGGYFTTYSTSGTGVLGAGDAYGMHGYSSGYAVYATGDMGASGTKTFRIDHPIDPANKYLLHYAAESPEVINFYSGKVTLGESGEAVVELPAYFAGINKDPRYTLTAVGAPMPMLHVAEEINEAALAAGERAGPGVVPPVCWFRIAGGVPGAKVSWEVKALRNDLRIRLHGAPVEREKTGPERGKYQHPEYYGQPPERGMDFDAQRERNGSSRGEAGGARTVR